MKRRKDRRKQAICDLNLTNLIDVVFAVLIIFMITAPMLTQGIQVDLPEAQAQNVESNETIQVTINAEREIFVDHELVPLLDFRRHFTGVFNGRSEVPVFVNADRTVPYGIVMRVISEIQHAGVVKLGFLTTPLENTGGGR